MLKLLNFNFKILMDKIVHGEYDGFYFFEFNANNETEKLLEIEPV